MHLSIDWIAGGIWMISEKGEFPRLGMGCEKRGKWGNPLFGAFCDSPETRIDTGFPQFIHLVLRGFYQGGVMKASNYGGFPSFPTIPVFQTPFSNGETPSEKNTAI